MRVVVFQTGTILSSWSCLAIPDVLRRLGHEVVVGRIPTNAYGQVRYQFRSAKEKAEVLASFPDITKVDMVLATSPEYYEPWLSALYPDWGNAKIPKVAIFSESQVRGMARNYDRWTHWFSPDPSEGHPIKPAVDIYQFCPDKRVVKDWDAGFIGSVYPKRVEFLEKLAPLIPDVDFRVGQVECRDLNGERHQDWADLMVDNIRRLKIHVNLPSNNPMTCQRPLETMACGTLCISYKPNDDLFEHGKHLLYYNNEHSCAMLIKEALANPDWANKITQNGKKYTRLYHSLEKILDELIQQVIS
jgi:hypothetical protein